MTYNGLPAIHPGEYLTEILEELSVSQAQFARAIGVSPMRITKGVKKGVKSTAGFFVFVCYKFRLCPDRYA